MARRDPLLTASLIAADLAAVVDREDVRGFMLRDVRFFFLLFRNWLERDLREPDRDIDLTQIRRACEQLTRQRRIVHKPRPRLVRRPRARYTLTLAGVLALVDELVEVTPDRSFEEGLFVILFAAAYRTLVIRRAEQAGAPVARKRVARALDPRVIITALRRMLTRQHTDLRERMAGGDRLLAAARAGRVAGDDDATIIRRLETISPYQLHHIRPLHQLLLGLPPEIREFEMTDGIVARRDLVFAPLLAQTAHQLDLLSEITTKLR